MLKKIIFISLFTTLLSARIIIDGQGKEVKIPDTIERASPMMGIFVQIAISLGNGDKIVSGASRGLPPMMVKVFPNIKRTGFRGSVGASVEALIQAKTQVVFGTAGVLFDENIKKQFEAAGIAVVRTDNKFATPQDVKDKVAKIAEIFGDESIQRAKEFNVYYDEAIEFVRSRTSKISEKKRVLVLNYSAGNFGTINDNFIAAEYIRIAGGQHLCTQTGSLAFRPTLNEEQIIVYDPDIIITDSVESIEQIKKNPPFKQLKAVKSGQIYAQPEGVMPFWAGTEGGMQVFWLAKILHPNEFKDLSVEDKVREFYKEFYNYTLNDEELKEILNPRRVPMLF